MSGRPITVCLTSIPPRFAGLSDRLSQILAQGPDALALTVPFDYVRFPDWDGTLPYLPDGVVVLRGTDRGPATKVLRAAEAFPNADLLICDDDCAYRPGWLDAFRRARAVHPDAAIAASSFDTSRLGLMPGGRIVQGFAGVLLRADWLLPLDQGHPAQWVDDIWISAGLVVSRVPLVDCVEARACVFPSAAPAALQDACIDGRTRHALNLSAARALSKAHGIWR